MQMGYDGGGGPMNKAVLGCFGLRRTPAAAFVLGRRPIRRQHARWQQRSIAGEGGHCHFTKDYKAMRSKLRNTCIYYD